LNRAAVQFIADWQKCLENIERQVLEVGLGPGPLEPARYTAIVRGELNTWFQPEHHRGAWLRALSNDRPEVAATIRQRLTEMRLPDCSYSLAPPLWAGLLLYGATIAAAALCLRATSLRTTDQAGVVIILSLLLAPMGLAVWRWESHRRRRHVAGTIRGIMEPEGVRLAAILQDR
jgi:hypothetical protein